MTQNYTPFAVFEVFYYPFDFLSMKYSADFFDCYGKNIKKFKD